MRAALMERGRIWIDTVPDPVPGPGEVLVRSLACGICGSDLHAARHTEAFVRTSREAGGAFKLTTFAPVVLGHEFCAEILDYGPGTRRALPIGTLVCSVPMLLREAPLGIGYSDVVPGGFAEQLVLSEQLLVPVPAGTPFEHAALTEPMAVGLHAVAKAKLAGGETVLVIGCGPVGLAVIAALRLDHAGPILAADLSPGRRALAARLGAQRVVDPREESPFASLERREDVVVFECVGVPGMIDRIFLGAPRNARVVVVGVCLEPDTSRPLVAVNKELNVQFVLGYSFDEFARTLQHIAEGDLDVAPS